MMNELHLQDRFLIPYHLLRSDAEKKEMLLAHYGN